jgi:asparagine synthase (glutamine-hydrolysing)
MATALTPGMGQEAPGQTFAERDGWVILADASLYHKTKLLQELGESPDGDAALILASFIKWGQRCVEHVYGDFAFAIFNSTTGELFCGRDPLGVRPFFYTTIDGVFVFATELRLVKAAFERQPELSLDYLLNTLVKVISPKEQTAFEVIQRLAPAHTFSLKDHNQTLVHYWEPDTENRIERENENEKDCVEVLRELLVNAVEERCAGANLGAELSGGLDSSTVTGIAAEYAARSNQPFTAYSNVFPEDSGIEFKDEREFIADMLTFRPMDWKPVTSQGISMPDIFRHTVSIQGVFPQQNYNVFNYGLFRTAGETGTRILLSGFGGDELVSARVSFPWNELISAGRWKEIKDELYGKGVTIKSLLKPIKIIFRYLHGLVWKPDWRSGVFTPELLGRRMDYMPIRPEYNEKHLLARRHREHYRYPVFTTLAEKQWYRVNMDHLPQRMEYCYAAAAQFGMEYRYPLLDVNLVTTFLAMPSWLKQKQGTNRYLFRQAIQGFVPESIRNRDDKSGTTIPHNYHSLVTEKKALLNLLNKAEFNPDLLEMFDFDKFPDWVEKLVKRDPVELNYLNPSLFYTYLMVMEYFEGVKSEK